MASAVPIRGHDVTVVWDRDGSRYPSALVGLAVWLDGTLVCHAPGAPRRCVLPL